MRNISTSYFSFTGFLLILLTILSISCQNTTSEKSVNTAPSNDTVDSIPTIQLVESKLESMDSNIVHNDSSTEILEFFHAKYSKNNLPFIGIKHFETRPAASGKGTPHLSIEIKRNGNVIFHYWQNNAGKDWDDPTKFTKAKYYAGKFKRIIKCDFSNYWDDFPRYYIVTENYIYEVDKSGNRLYMEDCCKLDNLRVDNTYCYCEGELWNRD